MLRYVINYMSIVDVLYVACSTTFLVARWDKSKSTKLRVSSSILS